MKIGVFGDSFANHVCDLREDATIWYKILRQQGHSVEVFGESGSSILFSAVKIEQAAQNYELVIWCLTTPGRISFRTDNNQWHHVWTQKTVCKSDDVEVKKKHEVAVEWIKWMVDNELDNLESAALVRDLQIRHQNILVVPCFRQPMKAKFNLSMISELEMRHWFPDKSLFNVHQEWQDLRPGHIAQRNQIVLGELIGDALSPGIFQTSMNNFNLPTETLSQVFKKYDFIR